MSKFLSVIIALVSLEFTTKDLSHAQIEEVIVEFSETAIGIESGQPIFSKNMKIWVSNPTEAKYKMYFNEEEKELSDKRMEISGLDSGTYTLMILASEDSNEEKRTIGFTIQ